MASLLYSRALVLCMQDFADLHHFCPKAQLDLRNMVSVAVFVDDAIADTPLELWQRGWESGGTHGSVTEMWI